MASGKNQSGIEMMTLGKARRARFTAVLSVLGLLGSLGCDGKHTNGRDPMTGDAGTPSSFAGNAAEAGAPGSDTGGHSGSGGSAGTAGGGSEPPVPATGDGEYSAGLEAEESVLATNAEGALRWLFTVENTTAVPACRGLVAAKLYDSAGQLLAGSEVRRPYLDDTTPSFYASVIGSLYQAPGRPLVNCLPPGGRGIGLGSFLTPNGTPVVGDELERLLAQGVRIDYTFSPGPLNIEGIELADDLLQVAAAELKDAAGVKALQGTATSGGHFSNWQIHAAFFDADDALIDYVSTSGLELMAGAEVEFELTPVDSAATRFEIYVDGQALLK